jgi:hypothetical protein
MVMRRSERGIAIPTVLVALVALTALGLAMSISTQGEVVVSGAQQRSMQSFHAADGGINYSLGLPGNFDDASDTPAYRTDTAFSLPFKATIGVTFLSPVRLPPPGLRVSALKVASFHFLLSSTGEAPVTVGQVSTTSVEMEASKLGPSASGVN